MKTKIEEINEAIRNGENIYLECLGKPMRVTQIVKTERDLDAITGSSDRFNRRSWAISNVEINKFLKQMEDHKNCAFPGCNNCDICKDGS